jgi:hypothetical protein
MSRARQFDRSLLEREYIYDAATPPISITALADKHGMNRGHLADLSRRGKWYEKRKAVRLTIGDKVLEAMTDQWAESQTAIRNRMLEVNMKLLAEAEKAIAAGEVKITRVADVTTIIAAMRVLLGDQAVEEANKDENKIIDVNTTPADPAAMAEMLPLLKRLMAGEEENGRSDTVEGHAGTDAPAGAAGAQQN